MSQAIIFDLDGTLVDSCATCVDILSQMIEDRGADHEIDRIFAREFMSLGGQTMVTTLLGPVAQDPVEDLKEFRSRYQAKPTCPSTLFPGVLEGLQSVHDKGLRLAICSNKPQNLCENVLRDTEIARYFEVIVGGSPSKRPKPATDLLDATLAALGCRPHDCLFVGDSELDYWAASALSMPFAFLTYGYAEAGWRFPGELSFDAFPDLSEMVLSRFALRQLAVAF
jgi:phosphoglycolate phosphatase